MKRIDFIIAIVLSLIVQACTSLNPVSELSSPTSPNTPVSTETLIPEQLALQGVTTNSQWTPYTRKFDGVSMVLVPAGCFMMGSNDGDPSEQPVHEVCFEEPFWIDMIEVTIAQYGSPGCWSAEHLPRGSVTWYKAVKHCESRGARLPTEAEWEYAARGPDGLVYPWGNTFDADNAVYPGNADDHVWEAGSRPGDVSWVGAYDLSGNLMEWVADWYGNYPSGQQINPTGPESGEAHVIRGASYYSGVDDSYASRYLRAADRDAGRPGSLAGCNVGFRCALSY